MSENNTIEFPFEVDLKKIEKDINMLPNNEVQQILKEFEKNEGAYLDSVMDLKEELSSFNASYSKNLKLIKNAIKSFHEWVDPVLPYWNSQYEFYDVVENYVSMKFSKTYRKNSNSDISKYDDVEFYNICFLYDLLDYYEKNSERIKKELKEMKK